MLLENERKGLIWKKHWKLQQKLVSKVTYTILLGLIYQKAQSNLKQLARKINRFPAQFFMTLQDFSIFEWHFLDNVLTRFESAKSQFENAKSKWKIFVTPSGILEIEVGHSIEILDNLGKL